MDIGLPRDTYHTVDITAAVKGYAVADEQGSILAKFQTLQSAEKAIAGAKIRLTVDVDVPSEEAVEA